MFSADFRFPFKDRHSRISTHSSFVSLSLKPFANGFETIFSCVTWKETNDDDYYERFSLQQTINNFSSSAQVN